MTGQILIDIIYFLYKSINLALEMCSLETKILKHPTLNFAQEIKAICSPLQKFQISYFAQARINKEKEFACLTTGPEFLQHYLKNNYYNADIHLASKEQFGQFVIWDAIERVGLSDKMHTEAGQFGVKHTFTIIEKYTSHTDYFHFATDISDKKINQVYLNQLDALKLFILFFKEKVSATPQLKNFLNVRFQTAEQAPGYTIKDEHLYSDKQQEFLTLLQNSLTPTELEILKWLHWGKTISQISQICNLAEITINKYIARIKTKTGCFTQFQLGEFYARYLGT